MDTSRASMMARHDPAVADQEREGEGWGAGARGLVDRRRDSDGVSGMHERDDFAGRRRMEDERLDDGDGAVQEDDDVVEVVVVPVSAEPARIRRVGIRGRREAGDDEDEQ